MTVYQVAIIGGGVSGCATALSLCRNLPEVSCLVIDNANPLMFKIGESLPPESGRILQYLDPSLTDSLSRMVSRGEHTVCTGNASAWSSPILEERHAIMNPFGHGLHLNRAAFDELLRNSVRDVGSRKRSASAFTIATFKGVRKGSDGIWNIEIDVDGEKDLVRAEWVIDATGRKASVATKVDSRINSRSPLLAFYGIFISESYEEVQGNDNDRRTLIEAAIDGWWYSSLICHNPCTRIVVFHTLPTHPSAKSSRRSAGFLDQLQASSTHISDIITKWDYRLQKGYPCCTAAGSSTLDRAYNSSQRWAAVGDAAMAFDPLSSQGMMTALEMGTYIGLQLAQRLSKEITDDEFDRNLGETYAQVQAEYEKNRTYYYSIVKRFSEEMFWKNVVGDTATN
ncbi:Putative FAD-dependent oxidoreductase LodB [Psilocybe cubensis]|uniref:FAD-binding domain-containing protein n=2 Tax=Psilocybe cubensis TaxID=181762 RepID=A0A8H8CE85_PSICU|nr:Putative FAD-dependent oxidoreductase LodB [Psilocybe cubensis]KAH9476373.1 Putative FAD-dependent oxidoreductase LodB [Psilocybe cubensis]